VAYPDPKIVTVAAPINTGNATRPPQAHPHAQRRGSSPTSSSPEAVNNRAADLGYRELVGDMLVVNSAAHATLRRVFPVRRVRREGSELTITMPVGGEQAPASPVEGLVA